MADIAAGPQDVEQVIQDLAPGDTVSLRPGIYRRPLLFSGRHGTSAHPITLRGVAGVIFDGCLSADDFREAGNRLALDGQAQGYPGIYPHVDRAMITLRNCSHLVLEGFRLQRCWPTSIILTDSRDIGIRRLDIEDSTFAIAAQGRDTGDIEISQVHWRQDVSRDHRLWRTIAWEAVHGEQPVDIERDWRLFDGDFFRSFGIRGNVAISGCRIEHAFNAVHGFNHALDRSLNNNFVIRDCSFSYVRDNVFEPEEFAQNWWFYRNRIFNVHKPFSIEGSFSSYIYIFANLIWFDEIPGQAGQDNRAGGVFKLAKSQRVGSTKQYFFNNSLAVRSDYMRQGTLRGLRHWSNAIRYCYLNEGVCQANAVFFGDLSRKPTDTDGRFTTNWHAQDIAFGDDVICHPQYDGSLKAAGYGPFTNSLAADPAFVDPVRPGEDGAGLRLDVGSPCKSRAASHVVHLPDGTQAPLDAARDVGAFDGDSLMRWREFVPLVLAEV